MSVTVSKAVDFKPPGILWYGGLFDQISDLPDTIRLVFRNSSLSAFHWGPVSQTWFNTSIANR